MIKQIATFLLCLTVASSAYAMDLKEAVEAARINNPDLRIEKSNLVAAQNQLKQAYTGYLPNAQAGYQKGKSEVEVSGVTDEPDTAQKQISITQPLFKSGRTLYNVKRAKELVKSSEESLRAREHDVILQVIESYLSIVQAKEVLDLNENNEQVLKKYLEATSERFKLGEVTRTDVAQAEARYARAISDHKRAAGNLEIAKSNFKKITGIDPVGDFKLPKAPTNLPKEFVEFVEITKNSNPLILARKLNVSAAENAVIVSKANLLPYADLNASSTISDVSKLYSRTGEQSNQIVAVNVTVPIFQSGEEYVRIKQAKNDEERARGEFDRQNKAVIDAANSAWQNYDVAKANLASNEDNVKASELALSGVQQEADVGTRTTLDVLDAQQELFISKVNLVAAKKQLVQYAYDILAVMGNLHFNLFIEGPAQK